jgi:hypothetical protein
MQISDNWVKAMPHHIDMTHMSETKVSNLCSIKRLPYEVPFPLMKNRANKEK